MNDLTPNLFNALFEFHPRDGHTPKENFLSEGFAYVLKTCDEARDAWLSLALGQTVKSKPEVTTRYSERDEEGIAVFPDMTISGVLNNGKPFVLYSEHKWDSPCNSGQIRRYIKIAQQQGDHCCLAFVGASHRQKKEAQSSDTRMKGKAFLWAEVFQVLERLQNKPNILVQFLDFMKTHGLSPGRSIESATMVAFIQSSDFLNTLEHCANKLNDDFDWEFFPKRYRSDEARAVTNRWGRLAIEFATPEWKPTITVGFLIDERDHKLSFVNRQKGIDLLLRIEASPGDQKNIGPVLAELDRKRKNLSSLSASALLLRERGNGNTHSLIIIRSCLADVIEKARTQQDQLEAINQTLKGWGEILFGDGALENSFRQAGLDSGM